MNENIEEEQEEQEETTEPIEISEGEDIVGVFSCSLSMYRSIISLEDSFSDNELELLYRVVEAEVSGGDIESKSHVACVIFNRLYSKEWGNTLTDVLMAENQFAVVSTGMYKRVEITEDTILACKQAWLQDSVQGALFFNTKGKINSYAHRTKTYLFTDSVGHNFYK